MVQLKELNTQLTKNKGHWDELSVAVTVYCQLLKQPLLVLIEHKPGGKQQLLSP